MTRYLTAEQHRWIAQKYKEGSSLAELAKALGFSTNAIHRSLIRSGTERRPVGQPVASFPAETLQLVLRRNDEGASVTEIMQATGLGREQVRRVLRANGVEPKNSRIGARSSRWRGGRFMDDGGYWRVWVDVGHPYADVANASGYAMEHRLVMSEQLGRPVTRDESVHHINGDRGDNRPDNLQLRSGKHGNGVRHQCLDCGSSNVKAVRLT